jgi:hypothetical protein
MALAAPSRMARPVAVANTAARLPQRAFALTIWNMISPPKGMTSPHHFSLVRIKSSEFCTVVNHKTYILSKGA